MSSRHVLSFCTNASPSEKERSWTRGTLHLALLFGQISRLLFWEIHWLSGIGPDNKGQDRACQIDIEPKDSTSPEGEESGRRMSYHCRKKIKITTASSISHASGNVPLYGSCRPRVPIYTAWTGIKLAGAAASQ